MDSEKKNTSGVVIAAIIGAVSAISVALINVYHQPRPSGLVAQDEQPSTSKTGFTPAANNYATDHARAETLLLAHDYATAIPILSGLADGGDGWAADQLGHIYGDGRDGIEQDQGKAAKWYTSADQFGDADGTYRLALMYGRGLGGLPADAVREVELDQKAAAAGNALAMDDLGDLYLYGNGGLPKDPSAARRLYEKAVALGVPDSMTSLGIMYRDGLGGLDKDPNRANELFKRGADLGNARAMIGLATSYRDGLGLPVDRPHALELYRSAARAGNTDGMTSIGEFYEYGLAGLTADDSEALRWYQMAADRGDARAVGLLERVKRRNILKKLFSGEPVQK